MAAWKGDITLWMHEGRFRTEPLSGFLFAFKNKTSTVCLGLGAMAASSLSKPETSSWRRLATPGTIPASSVL